MRIGDAGSRAVTLMSPGSQSTADGADHALEIPVRPRRVVAHAMGIFARRERAPRREADGEEQLMRDKEFA